MGYMLNATMEQIEGLTRGHAEAVEHALERCIAAGFPVAQLEYPAPSTIPENATSYVVVRGTCGAQLARVWIETPDPYAERVVFTVKSAFAAEVLATHAA